ncbi:MAG TPA: hypothetical protein DCZ92_07250 [Elusimicrobia bacterium]|nr:MAG: hypothetical protein A2016_02755 [Elusimicrobia bacterium GWF2_62_30]HBA60602.1 hypothetical protein [Elusimicrobiota bacterium]
MDMDAAKTDELIAKAIAGLPYRRPSAGFALKVMAAVAAAQRPVLWRDYTLKIAGGTVAAWEAALCFCFAKLAVSYLPDMAAFLIQPGGFARAGRLLAAKGALLAMKLKASLLLLADLASAAAGSPAYYEVAAAALVCAGVVYAVSAGKPAHSYGYGGN